MRGFLVAAVLLATGCVTTGTATCDDGTICREGTVCHPVGERIECVTPDQLLACDTLDDEDACNGGLGTCFSGACLPAGCGNGRREGDEECDDSNIAFGDDCSPSCKVVRCGNDELDPFLIENGTPVPLEQCDEGDLRGHDGCSSTCQVELPRWREVAGLPRPRSFAAVSVETDARKIVMFGGFDNDDDSGADTTDVIRGAGLAETWELSGGAWNLISTIPAPPPRGAPAMAFDGTRTIMFGGVPSPSSAALSDTWQYANGAWSMLTPEIIGGPERLRRFGHAMVFVPGRGIVMFGGSNKGEASNETWIFDGTRWVLQDLVVKPPARLFHSLAYDPVRDVVVLTGGIANLKELAPLVGTWQLSASGWTSVSSIGIGPRVFGATAVYDRIDQRIVLSGGRTGAAIDAYSESMWFYAGTWSSSSTDPITPRFGVVGAADPETGRPVVFGGRNDAPCGALPCPTDSDVWSFDPAATPTWTRRGYIPAPGLSDHAAAFDVDRRRLVVFGGVNAGGSVDDETYEVIEGSWIKPNVMGASPLPRRGAAMAYGRIPGALTGTLMFGGAAGGELRQDTWRWDGTTWTPIMGPQPDGRRFASMVFDAGRQRFVLFGGEAGVNGPPRNDTWELGPGPSGPEWTSKMTGTSPPRRSNFAMAYDPSRALTWVWGGRGLDAMAKEIELADLWSYDGTTWTEHPTSSGPGARAGAKFAYDAGRRTMILFGGGPPATNEAWEWNGETWSFISTFEVPPTRYDHILFSHPLGGVMAHGGDPAGPTSFSQYRLVRENLEPYAACHAEIDDDSDGQAGCADPDCWATCTPWCPPGVPPDECADLPDCGDGICSEPRESCGICPGDCGVCP